MSDVPAQPPTGSFPTGSSPTGASSSAGGSSSSAGGANRDGGQPADFRELPIHWCGERIAYDGSQLRAHWLLDRFGMTGDALVAFRGPCHVLLDEVADLADIDGPGIAADDMVHFVWECFRSTDLLLATHRQRLFAAQVAEVLTSLATQCRPERIGDDLYVGGGKLSISIATVSPVSSLMHFAVNASPGGAPVKIATLEDLGVNPEAFAHAVLARVSAEQGSIVTARAKVRAKGEWR